MRNFIKFFIVFSCIFVSVPVFIFLLSEYDRERLIESYRVPSHFYEKIFSVEKGYIFELLNSGETILCAVGSYGNVENLNILTSHQKKSLPKSRLPSEDMSWYLLFFNNEKISRVYMFDNQKLQASVNNNGAGCVRGDAPFFFSNKNNEAKKDYKFDYILFSKD